MRIGIDLGGTKIEAVALMPDGSERSRRRRPTPNGDYRGIMQVVADLVGEIETDVGTKGSIGIATPGSISPHSGLMRNSNSTVLNGMPFDRDLSEFLGREVRTANDANCFVLSEAVDGAAAGAATVFGVIIGTGVGGGLVVDRKLLNGHNGIGGEWGHNPIPFPIDPKTPPRHCFCGRINCQEQFLSGGALAREHQERTSTLMSASAIADAAANGDLEARQSLDLYADRLAQALAVVINIFDPDAIVLGGGVSNVRQLYAELPPLIDRYAFSDKITTPVLRAMHGDSSGVRGAAWLWDEGERP
ncbi:MAG TPA: ROK family protein [Methylovirgula sp.]|nr:ROK family protein [Methylovirgula sp.]